KIIYKSIIDQLNSTILNELFQKIEKDTFFRYKQKFKNHEYLSSFFYPFQLEKYFLEREKAKKEMKYIEEKIFEEYDEEKINFFKKEWQIKKNKMLEIEEKIFFWKNKNIN
ncbi:MAG: hypothetical protein Q8885_01450, partial [Candidatus Phytoplasma stylosanthis]|nr:hypothetical protein [Candidatus Phytoplasma stylosanthis]